MEDSAAAAVYRVSEGLRMGFGCGFSWRPTFADRTYSQDLPQRLIGSLRDRRAQSERCRRFDSDSESSDSKLKHHCPASQNAGGGGGGGFKQLSNLQCLLLSAVAMDPTMRFELR